KLLPELTRCMKCQSFGSHCTKECQSPWDTCRTCAREHCTKNCTVTTPDKHHCVNCKADRHAAWDCKCPTFINLSKCYHSHLPDVAYRYFPKSDDPATWIRENEADQAWNEPPRDENG
ncbi:hypothetical protein SCLCIDRAFT_131171, partial [Scleroderma citrinum Foug A]